MIRYDPCFEDALAAAEALYMKCDQTGIGRAKTSDLLLAIKNDAKLFTPEQHRNAEVALNAIGAQVEVALIDFLVISPVLCTCK